MPCLPALSAGRKEGLRGKWYFMGLFYFLLSSSDSVSNKIHLATKVEPVLPLKYSSWSYLTHEAFVNFFSFSLLCPAVAGEGEQVTQWVPGAGPVSNHNTYNTKMDSTGMVKGCPSCQLNSN